MVLRSTRLLHQKAVLWAIDSSIPYDNYGEERVGSPSEINVGWEEKTTEIIGPTGSPVSADGTVVVDQDIEIGSILWLGALADLPSPVTAGLMQVIAFDKIPDTKGRRFTRTATIKKYKRGLPDVV